MGTTRTHLTKRGHPVPLTSPQQVWENFVKRLTLWTTVIDSAILPKTGQPQTRATIEFVRPASNLPIYINILFLNIYIYLCPSGTLFPCSLKLFMLSKNSLVFK